MTASEPQVEPVWCVVGNIVQDRRCGEGGLDSRPGTKHFSPGAKVYCFPPLWGDGYESVKVIGYHKGTRGRQLVVMVIESKWIENRRAELVYRPAIISRFAGAWDGSQKSKELAQQVAGEATAGGMIRMWWTAIRSLFARNTERIGNRGRRA